MLSGSLSMLAQLSLSLSQLRPSLSGNIAVQSLTFGNSNKSHHIDMLSCCYLFWLRPFWNLNWRIIYRLLYNLFYHRYSNKKIEYNYSFSSWFQQSIVIAPVAGFSSSFDKFQNGHHLHKGYLSESCKSLNNNQLCRFYHLYLWMCNFSS